MLNDEERAEMVRAYEAGASIVEVARATGRSNSTVRAELLRAGVTLRPRGGRRPRGTTFTPRVSTVLPSYGTTPQDVA